MKKGERNASSKSLLLVSGDSEFKRHITGALAFTGMPRTTLATAACGRDALRILARERPSLVVIDDDLPDTTGLDLLRALRRDGVKTLVIYVATHHTLELEREVRQLGVLYYTEKPPGPLVMERIVATALYNRRGDTTITRDDVPMHSGNRGLPHF